MIQRTVKKLIYALEIEMGDLPIRQPLPNAGIDYIDPFLLLHHHYSEIPEGSNAKNLGVGPHPHRGFSPVTIIYKGDVQHRDSRGNNSIVKSGGVQWMNAGMGIVHSERPSEDFAKLGGIQEIIQLWINTPSKNKLEIPAYFSMNKEDIPNLHLPNNDVQINVIAGNYDGTQGFNETFSEILMLDVRMKAGSEFELKVSELHNCIIYNLDARIIIDNYGIVDGHYLIWFNNDGEKIKIRTDNETRLLVLSGMPLNEPIQTYGPFVMSNQTEIMQAIKDYQMGKMGILIEDEAASSN